MANTSEGANGKYGVFIGTFAEFVQQNIGIKGGCFMVAFFVGLPQKEDGYPSIEPQKIPCYFPWNTGWLIGILIMVDYNPNKKLGSIIPQKTP